MSARRRNEQGAILVLTALMITALLVLVAIVIDLGATRSDRRAGQLAVDNAAAAAGQSLANPAEGPEKACEEALEFLAINLGTGPFTVDPTESSCADFATACSSTLHGATVNSQERLRATSGGYVVWVHYPVVGGTADGDRLLGRTSTIAGGKISSTSEGNLAGDACSRLGVELQTTGTAFFGEVAGQSERVSTVHSVVYGRTGFNAKDTPAFVMLERVDCGALVENNARGIFVDPSTNGPGSIHADSFATGDCGGETKRHVIYSGDLPSKEPGIQVRSFTDTSVDPSITEPGRITIAAAASTGRVADVVGGNKPGINVTPIDDADVVSRRPVDEKYNSAASPAITSLHKAAYDALTSDPVGYDGTAGCDGVVTPPTATRVLVECGNYTSTLPLPPVTEIEFTGSLSYGNNESLTLSNATRVVVRGGISLPQGSLTLPNVEEFYVGGGVFVGGNGTLAINSLSATSCDGGTAPSTRFVVFGGSPALELNNSTSACKTSGYLAGPLTVANSTYAGTGAIDENRSRHMLTSGTPHDSCTLALPCPRKIDDNNTATGATFSFGGGTTVTWTAPNNIFPGPVPDGTPQGFEDLALWMEGAETASMGNNAVWKLSGVAFAPNARLNVRSPSSALPQNAQFIARALWLYQGTLRMEPTPSDVVQFPTVGGSRLIR